MNSILSLSPRAVVGLLLAVAALKALVLFAVLPAVGGMTSELFRSTLFPDGYGDIAWNLIQGNGYNLLEQGSGTMFRTPGYVFFLVPIFTIFGKSIAAVQVAQYFLSIGTAYLIYRLALALTEKKSIGVIAAVLYLLSPAAIMADNRALIESFLTFCVVAFLLLLHRAWVANTLGAWFWAGLVFGWILLVRSSAGLFPMLLIVLIAWRARASAAALRQALLGFAAFCVAAALVVSPWIIRNYALSGNFEPTMTVKGAAFFQSVYLAKSKEKEPDELVSFLRATELMDELAHKMGVRYEPGFLPYFYDIDDEVKYYKYLGSLGVTILKQEPTLMPRMLARNAFRFWFKGVTPGATYIYVLSILPLLILATIGCVLALRQRVMLAPMIVFAIAYYISYLPALAFARYCLPVLPLLCIGSAIAIDAFVRKRWGAAQPAASSAVLR